MKKQSSYKLLGAQVDALSILDLNLLIEESIEKNEKWIIANHNLHSLYLFHNDPKMQAFYAKAEYTHIDSMPLVFVGKLLGFPLKREQRVTYADWVWPLMTEAASKGWRVFYLGSKPGVAEQGASILRQRFPGLEIACAHGYIDMDKDSQENLATLTAINAYKPHVLMVGMGMPRQEHWISENLEHIQTNTILSCGACIDYVAGVIPTPPRWMGKMGLEWLYRLLTEPRRLWRRYLLEPWFLCTLLLREIWGFCKRSGGEKEKAKLFGIKLKPKKAILITPNFSRDGNEKAKLFGIKLKPKKAILIMQQSATVSEQKKY